MSLLKDQESKRISEIKLLEEQFIGVKQKLKEKNDQLAKLQNQHMNETREINDLKYKLQRESTTAEDANYHGEKIKTKFAELQQKYVHNQQKVEKMAKQLVIHP